MININNIKIGQKVWYQEHWSQMIVWGKVTNITKFDNNEYGIEVTGEFHEEGSFVGTTTQPLDNLYATKYEAIEAIRKSRQAWVDTYKKRNYRYCFFGGIPTLTFFWCRGIYKLRSDKSIQRTCKGIGV